MTEEEVVTHILNPSGATANVDLLDRTVDSFYGATSNEQVRYDIMIQLIGGAMV